LLLHRSKDRIEDVAVVFLLVMDRNLADFPGEGIESGNHRRVGARMRHEADDVAECDGQVEVECRHPFRIGTASGKLGRHKRRRIRHVDRRRDPVKPDRHLRDYAAPPSRGKQRAMVSDAAAVRAAAVRTWFQVVQLVRSEEEEVRAVISQVRHLNVPLQ
jgi:hypothetical protein